MTETPEPSGLVARALDQMRQLVLMFLYLYVLFGLFVLNEFVILKQHEMSVAFSGFAVINALVLAKVMLVVEDMRLARWLERRPLIYPILFDAALLTVLFIIFHIVERMAVGMWRGGTLDGSLPALGGGGLLGVLCVALILFFSLLPYFAFKHLARTVGVEKVKRMIFKEPPAARQREAR